MTISPVPPKFYRTQVRTAVQRRAWASRAGARPLAARLMGLKFSKPASEQHGQIEDGTRKHGIQIGPVGIAIQFLKIDPPGHSKGGLCVLVEI